MNARLDDIQQSWLQTHSKNEMERLVSANRSATRQEDQ